MNRFKTNFAAAMLTFGTMSSAAFAGTDLQVFLWNAPGKMATDHRMESGVDRSSDSMGIAMSAASITAGEVTFKVLNTSKNNWHEMVVTRIDGPDAVLPYVASDYKVDEDAAGSEGEVAELKPGTSGEMTLTLTPGTYVVYCNVKRHYDAGMWTILTVK